MKLRIFTEPQQGASYQTLRSVALAAEELGFDAFFRSDHYLKMGSVPGLPGPTEAWATLAALAVETSRIRLGTLVTPATFRLPGPAGDHGGAGRPDERRPDRARPRRRLVRGRAHRLRRSLPAAGGALRHPHRAARDHHRAVGHGRRRDVLLLRNALPAVGLARAAEARAAAAPAGDPGRRGRAPHAPAGGQVRGRVQPGVPLSAGFGGRVRARPRGLRGRGPPSRRP